jgi:hypothetical protein
MPLALEAYALIGDQATAALVGRVRRAGATDQQQRGYLKSL